MKQYTKADVSEQQLEDLVRQHTDKIEEGLVYVDHQKQAAGGRLDVLMVDSGRALVIAELKIVQDEGMLMQGVDYYDYVSMHVEAFARLYLKHNIDPTQPARLFLIAPSFSQTLINRCKWIDLPISLFTYHCLKFDGETELVPVFAEQPILEQPVTVEISQLSDHIGYIIDVNVRNKVSALLDEIKNWKSGSISLDAVKIGISMKVNGRVFAYFLPRRQHYILATYNADDVWAEYIIKEDSDLENVKTVMKTAMERRLK